jgi:hypothetical protein
MYFTTDSAFVLRFFLSTLGIAFLLSFGLPCDCVLLALTQKQSVDTETTTPLTETSLAIIQNKINRQSEIDFENDEKSSASVSEKIYIFELKSNASKENRKLNQN